MEEGRRESMEQDKKEEEFELSNDEPITDKIVKKRKTSKRIFKIDQNINNKESNENAMNFD